MGNKAGKKKHESPPLDDLPLNESSQSDPPNSLSLQVGSEPPPNVLPLNAKKHESPPLDDLPPNESSQSDPPSLEVGSEPPPNVLPPNESSDPPDPHSLTSKSESNLKSQQARTGATPLKVSRQEKRRKQRIKRKFKGTLTRYTFILVHRNREVAIAMAFTRSFTL